jgi:glycosyltransferase involved in cell wall biosynthesis
MLKIYLDKLVSSKIVRNASKIIALNSFEANQYKHIGIPEEKIAIIPNGIDLSEYVNLPPKGAFKKKFNILEDKRIVLYLGRIHKIKGIDFLIKAYAYLKNKMNFKDAVLVIAGPDDGYLSKAKILAYTLRVSDSVVFVGPLYGRDKLAAYVDSDLCVLPSRHETFPMALLEVYACGKPIIASNLESLKELIVDGETGLLFEAGNFKQLAEKAFYLLNDCDKAIEIGRKARLFVEEKYSIDKVIDDLEVLYMEVASQKPS